MRDTLLVVLVALVALPSCATLATAEEQSVEDKAVAPPEERAEPSLSTSKSPDEILWAAIKDSDKISDFEFYLSRFPKGRYSAVAELKVEQLKEARTPPPSITEGSPSITKDSKSRTRRKDSRSRTRRKDSKSRTRRGTERGRPACEKYETDATGQRGKCLKYKPRKPNVRGGFGPAAPRPRPPGHGPRRR